MRLSDELRALADRIDLAGESCGVEYFFVGAVMDESEHYDFAFHQGGPLAARTDTVSDLAKKGALDHFGKMQLLMDRSALVLPNAA